MLIFVHMLKRILLPAAILIAMVAACTPAGNVRPTKNVIFILTDGTSEGALAAARWYQRYMTGDMSFNLSLDQYLCGLVQTHESDAPITCSAPGMSAYMTGVPARAGNVSMNPLPHPGQDLYPVDEERGGQPAATVLEAARYLKGKSTGLVCTVTFPHATPGAASAHYPYRWDYHPIALQQSCEGLDLVFGSGIDVLTDEMRAMIAGTGATLIEDDVVAFREFEPAGRKASANAVSPAETAPSAGISPNPNRLWALFGGNMTEFEIDRVDSEQPSLSEMTAKAIDMLSRNKKGFFLMVEGSKVDYGAHSMDPVETITELLEFDRAIKVATDFARRDRNTTVNTYGGFGDNEGVTSTPERWRNICDLAGRLSELAPVLVERTPSQPAMPEVVAGPKTDPLGDPAVTCLLKRHGGKNYLFAVNATAEPVTARFAVPRGQAIYVLYENRALVTTDDRIVDDFAPFAVHIYKW